MDLTTAYLHTSHQLLGGDDNFWFHFWIKHDILDLLVDIDSLVFANLWIGPEILALLFQYVIPEIIGVHKYPNSNRG